MPADRPTFHESWYRVAELRPRLRAALQTHRQHFRGQRWHVVQDSSSNEYFRLSDAAAHFVGLLDGRRTVEEAWRISNESHGDAAPTQGEAISLLGQLYTSNLLQSDFPADAASMFENYRTRRRREMSGVVQNLLFVRIPLIDPDAFLTRWERIIGVIFAPAGLMAWCGLMLTASVVAAGRLGDLVTGADQVLDPSNLFLLYVSMAIVKTLHELGHGFAAKRIGRLTESGGEVHTLGITFLVLTPLPYVDASSAWAFRSKWHRALVGAAGMYVELALAAIAVLVWANTSPGTVHALAYNAIFVAGVSTLLFNANPLLKFDGYYILSDLLEVPNLAHRSREALQHLVKRFAFGIKHAPAPALDRREWFWFPAYAVASLIYRIGMSVGILLFLIDRLFFVGGILAVMAISTWLIMPAGRFVRYLLTGVEVARCRRRAMTVTATLALLVLTAVGVLPAPDRARAEGVVEPVDVVEVIAEADGFVEDVLRSGKAVAPDGAPLAITRSVELETELRELIAQRRLASLEYDRAVVDDIAVSQTFEEHLLALDTRITDVERRQAALIVHAPFRGRWIAPEIDRMRGAYVERGDRIGIVASDDRLLVRVVADQRLGPRVEPEAGRGAAVEIRVRGRPDLTITGRVQRVLPAGFLDLPSAALGYQAGGSLALAASDETGTKSAEPFFEAHITVDPADARHAGLRSGQRVVVRFEMPSRPLAVQWWRSLRQLVQRRFQL